MINPEPTAPVEETLDGQVGPLLPQLSAWLTHIGIPHISEDGAVGMTKQSGGLDFEVIWEELPGILVGFVALLDPLDPGDSPDTALRVLESIEAIPPRYIEVATYSVMETDRTPGLYLRLRMPLRFAPETVTDALELVSYMTDRHASALGGEES